MPDRARTCAAGPEPGGHARRGRRLPGRTLAALRRALQAAGDTAHAAAVLAAGQAWVRNTAAENVPDEFRESFLHRNPTNAALLAMKVTQPA